MKTLIVSGVLLLFLASGFVTHAKSSYKEQEKTEADTLDPEIRKLRAVVVTATRSRRDVYDVPVRVNILGAEKIESMPALSADDYLRAIPGVSVSRGASFLGSSTVSLRGMGGEAGRTLVMIDGVPVNKSDGGSVNWNAIHAGDIARIEVVKGPGSSIHGGNAMGGVINLITPTPNQKVQGSLSQSIGTFETANTQASVSGRVNDLFWGINGRYRNSNGYISAYADEVDEYSVASFLDEYQYSGRIGYFLSPKQMIEFATSYYLGQRGTGSRYSGYGFENDDFAAPDGAYNEYTGLNGRLVYRGQFNQNSHLNITLFGQRENYQNIRESIRNERISRYDVESIRDDAGFLSSFNTTIGGSHQLTTGIDLRSGAVDGADIYLTATDKILNLGKMNQLGVYVQDEMRFGASPWSVLAGLRYDYARFYDGAFLIEEATNQTSFLQDFTGNLNDATFNALSPRISLQYHKKDNYRIYASYSRGFRAPVLDDMCRTGLISGGMKLANPELKPEYLDNIELGGDIFLAEDLSIAPAIYYSLGTDYHAFIGTGDSLTMNNRNRPIRIKDNIGKVAIMGAEVALNWKMVKGVDMMLSYSYNETEIREYKVFDAQRDDNLEGKAMVYQPRDIFFASLSWRNPIVNAFVSFNYKGAQWLNDINTEEIESYSFIDLHLWRNIYRGLSVGVQVHNLLDQDFIDSRNMIGPGRMINAELKYSF